MEARGLFVQNLHSLIDLQRRFRNYSFSDHPLPFEDYDSLQLFLLEECDRLNLQRNTKFLAKTYFDLAVSQLGKVNCESAPLYLLTALALAVKFNENRQISQCFSVECLVQMTDGKFQHKDFQEAELQMLTLLGYRLQLVTPYDYALIFKSVIRQYHNKKAIELKIYTLLDFAISLPYLTLLSPSLLFWACFLEVLQTRLRRDDLELISNIFQEQQEVRRIRQILKRAMEKVLNQQKLKDNDFNAL